MFIFVSFKKNGHQSCLNHFGGVKHVFMDPLGHTLVVRIYLFLEYGISSFMTPPYMPASWPGLTCPGSAGWSLFFRVSGATAEIWRCPVCSSLVCWKADRPRSWLLWSMLLCASQQLLYSRQRRSCCTAAKRNCNLSSYCMAASKETAAWTAAVRWI